MTAIATGTRYQLKTHGEIQFAIVKATEHTVTVKFESTPARIYSLTCTANGISRTSRKSFDRGYFSNRYFMARFKTVEE